MCNTRNNSITLNSKLNAIKIKRKGFKIIVVVRFFVCCKPHHYCFGQSTFSDHVKTASSLLSAFYTMTYAGDMIRSRYLKRRAVVAHSATSNACGRVSNVTPLIRAFERTSIPPFKITSSPPALMLSSTSNRTVV